MAHCHSSLKDTPPSLVWGGRWDISSLTSSPDSKTGKAHNCWSAWLSFTIPGGWKISGAQNAAQAPPLRETLVGRRLLRQGNRHGEGEQTFCSAGWLRATPWSQLARLGREAGLGLQVTGVSPASVSLGALSTHSLGKEKESF